jgi:PPOX class probable F420-dependent enzyme
MAIEINETLAQRLRDEQIIWLTTVRGDGTPLPTPIWFLWDGETFLIFTQPSSLKLRNIAQNPRVALNFHTDQDGGSVVVFTGTAQVDQNPAPAEQVNAYLEKYREGLQMIGMTPESMMQSFSTVLRVTPTRVRTAE